MIPREALTPPEIDKGMKVMIADGLASETMTTLTGGTFLIAMALLIGANNLQIGILAALPTATNIFQLISIWLSRRFASRRVICVVLSSLARLPLVLTGIFILLMKDFSVTILLLFLFMYYLFGSVSGPVWNAWMKDMIPENRLGSYFSRRTSYMQWLNVGLGICIAIFLDYVKANHTNFELDVYGYMFVIGGIAGIFGAAVLLKGPEPRSVVSSGNFLELLRKPLADPNFRRMLLFNSLWLFAINIASPFFTVFMLKVMGMSLSYIFILTVLSQISSIFTIRIWGRYADRFSNKNIIALGGPLYIGCLIGWCFVGLNSSLLVNTVLLVFIHIFLGVANAGINLSITNISLKLSPQAESIIYLSTRNMVTSMFSGLAPIVGGILADYFSHRTLEVKLEWIGPNLGKSLHLIVLHQWNFLFLIGAFIALIALQILIGVREKGEVENEEILRIMRGNIKNNLKEYFLIGQIITWGGSIKEKFRKSN